MEASDGSIYGVGTGELGRSATVGTRTYKRAAFLFRLSAQGEVEWVRMLDGVRALEPGIQIQSNGDVTILLLMDTPHAPVLVRVRANGELAWTKSFAIPSNLFAEVVRSEHIMIVSAPSDGTWILVNDGDGIQVALLDASGGLTSTGRLRVPEARLNINGSLIDSGKNVRVLVRSLQGGAGDWAPNFLDLNGMNDASLYACWETPDKHTEYPPRGGHQMLVVPRTTTRSFGLASLNSWCQPGPVEWGEGNLTLEDPTVTPVLHPIEIQKKSWGTAKPVVFARQ